MEAMLGLLLLKLSEALRRENIVRASGKLGGVAGVFAGVHICKSKQTHSQTQRYKCIMAPTHFHELPPPSLLAGWGAFCLLNTFHCFPVNKAVTFSK